MIQFKKEFFKAFLTIALLSTWGCSGQGFEAIDGETLMGASNVLSGTPQDLQEPDAPLEPPANPPVIPPEETMDPPVMPPEEPMDPPVTIPEEPTPEPPVMPEPPKDPPLAANAFYVSTTGNDNNSGKTEAQAWRTLKYAASKARAGDTIYVKAGDYGNDSMVIANSGTAEAPIVFEGYKQKPGDSPTIANFDHSSSLNSSIMPLIRGGNRATGIGIRLNQRQYVHIKNFQITEFQWGVLASSTKNSMLENVIVTKLGDINDDYSGTGIMFTGGRNNIVKNSVVVNAAAEGIMVYGENELVTGCRVYGSDNQTGNKSALDYYIMTNGKNNIVENSLVHRVGKLAHGGHGIGIKSCGTGIIIRNNKAINIADYAFYARHRGAKGNHFINNVVEGQGSGLAFVARDGASDNIFEGGRATNVRSGIAFHDTTEDEDDNLCELDESSPTVVKLGGVSNTFKNITLENIAEGAIHFFYYDQRGARSHGNNFDGLKINGAAYLFFVEHKNYNNTLKNSTITGVERYSFISSRGPFSLAQDPDNNISLSLDVILMNNVFSNNGFSAPSQ